MQKQALITPIPPPASAQEQMAPAATLTPFAAYALFGESSV